jgi:hypothetical protein
VKQPDGTDAGSRSGVVVLTGECRLLRRALRPLVWVILEEVALGAAVDDGRLMARTSARQVAQQLGVNPSTAAEALRVLGRRGLVSMERETGPAGRFGLSVYQLRPPAGLTVIQPCTAEPLMVLPTMAQPDTAGAGTVSPCVVVPQMESSSVKIPVPGQPRNAAVGTETDPTSVMPEPAGHGATPGEGRRRRAGGPTASPGSSRHPGQTALDLGLGSS